MQFIKKNWHLFILAFFILVYIITLSTLSILRFNAFASGLDLGNMDQTVWNTLQGRFFTLTDGIRTVSRFAIHSDIALIFFTPFYLVWSSPHMLNILESLYLGLGAIPVYLIAQDVLRNKVIALIFACMYLLNPLLEWVDIFDYHAVSLAIPTLLAAFYCLLKRRWKWYFFFIIIALLTKEEISVQIALLGLIIAFIFNQRRVGMFTFVLGGAWFFLMVFVVMPYFSPQGKHWAFEWFQLGGETGSSITFIINRFLFDLEIRTYYTLLLKSHGFLSLAGLPWLVLTLPNLVINVLSSHSEMHSIKYHYTSGLIPGITIASIYGVRYLNFFLEKFAFIQGYKKFFSYLFVIPAFLIVLRTNYHHSPLPTAPACWCITYKVTKDDEEFEKLLQKIPQEASVTASTEIRAHVTHREHSYILPHATQSADFIAVIDQNRVIDNYLPNPDYIGLIKKLNEEKRYTLVKNIGHFFLYKKVE